MRDIKFRVWDNNLKVLYTPEMDKEEKNLWRISANGGDFTHSYDDGILMQYTGLKDKNGKEIYEGDKLLIRKPERNTQTHTGDNIPLGSYTEPLEPIINEAEQLVVFDNGCFCINDYDGEDQKTPLGWEYIKYTLDYAKECFCGGWSSYGDKFEWIEDLEYLLDEYNIDSEQELIIYLGIEIIGNIHEPPELL